MLVLPRTAPLHAVVPVLLMFFATGCAKTAQDPGPAPIASEAPDPATVELLLRDRPDGEAVLGALAAAGLRFEFATGVVRAGTGVAERFFIYSARPTRPTAGGLDGSLFVLFGAQGEVLGMAAGLFGDGTGARLLVVRDGNVVDLPADGAAAKAGAARRAFTPPVGLARSATPHDEMTAEARVAPLVAAQVAASQAALSGGFCDPVAFQQGSGVARMNDSGALVPEVYGSCASCQSAVKSCYTYMTGYPLDLEQLATNEALDAWRASVESNLPTELAELNIEECWYQQPEIYHETCRYEIWTQCFDDFYGRCADTEGCEAACIDGPASTLATALARCTTAPDEALGVDALVRSRAPWDDYSWRTSCDFARNWLSEQGEDVDGLACESYTKIREVLGRVDAQYTHYESALATAPPEISVAAFEDDLAATCEGIARAEAAACAHGYLPDFTAWLTDCGGDAPPTREEEIACLALKHRCDDDHQSLIETITAAHLNLEALYQQASQRGELVDSDYESYCNQNSPELAATSGCGQLPECMPLGADGTIAGFCACLLTGAEVKEGEVVVDHRWTLTVAGAAACHCPPGLDCQLTTTDFSNSHHRCFYGEQEVLPAGIPFQQWEPPSDQFPTCMVLPP